jgi:hypothetical protein
MTPDRLVLVEWDDATQPTSEWVEIEHVDDGPAVCQSVGWVLKKTARTLILAANQTNEPPQVSGVIRIPTSAIRRMVDLNPVEM